MSSTQRLIIEQQPYLKALARNVAKTLPHHVEYEELVAFGQVGLAEAAKAFDASRGVSFTTFAHYRIRGAIFDGLRKMTWLPPAVRKSVNAGQLQDEVAKQVGERAQDSHNPEQLAKQFAAAVERLGSVYLLSNLRDDEQGVDVEDKRLRPTSLESKEVRNRLKAALSTLPDDQVELVRMLYTENKSMAQVGEALGKNKSTVCRRHAEMLDALRAAIGVSGEQAVGSSLGTSAGLGTRVLEKRQSGHAGKPSKNADISSGATHGSAPGKKPPSSHATGDKGAGNPAANPPSKVKPTRVTKSRSSPGDIA